jgi:hypothetical protein
MLGAGGCGASYVALKRPGVGYVELAPYHSGLPGVYGGGGGAGY